MYEGTIGPLIGDVGYVTAAGLGQFPDPEDFRLEQPAPELAEQIAESRTGDALESVGVPRAAAPWLVAAFVLACFTWKRGR